MAFLIAALPAFLASTVEFVEAFTIVLVVGTTRSWRSALTGAAAALGTLALLVAVFGVTIVDHVDRHLFEVVVGTLLLLFGLRWLRKAILRYAGLIAMHDEDAIFEEERRELARARGDRDWVAFAMSYKATLLEGLEVAFIVVALGARGHHELVASTAGAIAACVAVAVLGAVVRRPLSRVPENTLKYSVGAMLCTFGVFWTAEGFGVEWPGDAVMLVPLFAATVALSWGAVRWLEPAPVEATAAEAVA